MRNRPEPLRSTSLREIPIRQPVSLSVRGLGLLGVECAGSSSGSFAGGQRAAFAANLAVHCLSRIRAGSVLTVDVDAGAGGCRIFWCCFFHVSIGFEPLPRMLNRQGAQRDGGMTLLAGNRSRD
jgi:hypothetical protein